MQHTITEYNKTVEITGYKGVSFQTAEAYLKADRQKTSPVEIQFFDADLIASAQHLYFAAVNAIEAFRVKVNISKSLAMETILYASAQRQIQKAIQRCGIKPESQNMAVLIIGDDPNQVKIAFSSLSKALGGTVDEAVLELTQTKITKIEKAFKVNHRELVSATRDNDLEAALTGLVIERLALLSTQL